MTPFDTRIETITCDAFDPTGPKKGVFDMSEVEFFVTPGYGDRNLEKFHYGNHLG